MNKEVSNVTGNFILFRLYKYYIIDSIMIAKNHGIKELFKRRGWKFLLIVISYYALRDTLIYLVIPYLAVKGIIGF